MRARIQFLHKLLILTIIPLVLAQLGTLFLVMENTEREVAANARRSLMIGAKVANEFLSARDQHLLQSAQLLSADFALRQAIAIGDGASAQSALANHAERVEANFAAFISVDGDITTSSPNYPHDVVQDRMIELRDTGAVRPASITMVGSRTYQTFASPMRAPTLIGYLVFGFAVDHTLANRLQTLTGLDVEILSIGYDSVQRLARASDEDSSRADSVLADLQDRRLAAGMVHTIGPADNESLLVQTPILQDDGRAVVMLHLSWRDAMAPFRAARSQLLVYGSSLLIVVIALGIWLSRSISKPIRSLTKAAERMAAGDYDSTIKIDSKDELATLAHSFNRMQSAIADREADIVFQSEHNPETGLPNQVSALRSLDQMVSGNYDHCCVLSIVLLRMGKIASTIGQTLSNDLLRQTADHLLAHLNRDGVLAHTGSSEFLMLIPGIDTAAGESIAHAIHRQLQSGIRLGSAHIILHAKIGVSVFPDNGEEPADIVRRALVARTDAQSSGDAVHAYATGREQHFERQLQVSNDLPRAISEGEIQVFYQPKIDVQTGNILGAEALARWQHGTLGNLRPDEFIPPAEESGTIVRLTRYVIDQTISNIAEWQREIPQVLVAVNLSTRDLLDDSLVGTIERALRQHRVSGERLILEVTESAVMENLETAQRVLRQLQELSIRIAIDDFGTGYSSLAQLKNLPLDELKIDKAFVLDLANSKQDELIVATTVELAHGLKLKVVAEGVEDEYSMRRLFDLGCDYAQGYFIGKPMPKAEFEAWLDSYEPTSWNERRADQRPFEEQEERIA
ncbi:MAG: EAL domain-containing protein [Pseudomonadota bacterium]